MNGKPLKCIISLKVSDTDVNISGQLINCRYSLPQNRQTIDGIIQVLHTVNLCKGVPVSEKLPKGFVKEDISSIHDKTISHIARSKFCKKLVPFCGKVSTCVTCSNSLKQFNRNAEKQKKNWMFYY